MGEANPGYRARFSHGWMSDTHPAALRAFLDLNHRLSAQQKYDQVVAMCETLIATYTAQERQQHPEASEREIFLRVAVRRHGRELILRAYGWVPDE